ncbi:MAG: hypothetical protein EOO77_23720 [Oxalobacteraceae bacterium]|nr:MAG: hypothetical protein EOO77_23720 [Oxalobacteraceae bacterium]
MSAPWRLSAACGPYTMTTRIEVERSLPVSAPCGLFVAACKAWTDNDGSRLLMRWPGRYGLYTVRELLDEIADSAAYTEHFWKTHGEHKAVIEVRGVQHAARDLGLCARP